MWVFVGNGGMGLGAGDWGLRIVEGVLEVYGKLEKKNTEEVQLKMEGQQKVICLDLES